MPRSNDAEKMCFEISAFRMASFHSYSAIGFSLNENATGQKNRTASAPSKPKANNAPPTIDPSD